MISTHRIARDASRDIARRDAARRADDAREEARRERISAEATEVFPPSSVEQRVALLDLYTAASLPGRPVVAWDEQVRRTYGVTWVRFVQVVRQLISDPEVYAQRPAECKRLLRISRVRAGNRQVLRRSA